MRSLLALSRLGALLLWSAALFVAAALLRPLDGTRARGRAMRWTARVQRLWARGVLRIAGVRVRVEAEGPAGVFVVASNHLSYVDVPVLASVLPGRFVAKEEIRRWPLLGLLTRAAGTLFVERRRRRDVVRVGEEMGRTLAEGVNVVLFPEGGSSRGAAVEDFHSALFEPAVRAGVPVLPVALSYRTPGEPWGEAWTVCWWGGMELPRHLWRLLRVREVEARVRWAPAPLAGRERKELAREAHAALRALFEPVRQAPVPPDLPWPELAEAGSR